MKRLIAPLTLAVSFLAVGAAVADTTPPASMNGVTLEAAIFGTPMPSPAAKPPRETCPGQFDISREAGYYECTRAACNQWCIEEGASYSAYEVWISWGICGCRCCP